MGGATHETEEGAAQRTPQMVVRRIGYVVLRSGRDFFADSGTQWAAAVAYYALLSLFPLLLAVVSIAAYVVNEEEVIAQINERLGNFLPSGSDQVTSIVHGAIEARGPVGLISVVTLLWTGTRVFSALTKSLNAAFDVDDPYGFLRRFLVDALMLCTIGGLFLVATGASFVLELLARYGPLGAIWGIARLALAAAFLLLAFVLLYRFVPRRRPSWQAAAIGGVVATALFLIARPLFLFYVERFGQYNLIYGSFGIVILLILWAWIVSLITLFGGEITGMSQRLLVEWRPLDHDGKRRDR